MSKSISLLVCSTICNDYANPEWFPFGLTVFTDEVVSSVTASAAETTCTRQVT